MIIRPLQAIAAGKKVVLVEIAEQEKRHPAEIVSFYQEKRITFPSENAIADPNQYTFSRKKSDIYQPVVLDGRVVRVLVLRKEQGRFRWKEVAISETIAFTNCFLLGLMAS